MTFLLPTGLLALLALPIIVVLHLLRERRRRVAVPSLLHWLNVPRRHGGERIRRLPLTLLLVLHLLIAALLGLALGRPQVFGALSGSARQTLVVLDASTSMAARDGAASRFAQARARAQAIVRGMRGDDRAVLIAAGRTARVVASGGTNDRALLLAALDGLQPGGTGTDLAGALTLAEAMLDPQRAAQIVVITDGALPPPVSRRLAAPLDWQQIGGDQPNRAIIAFAARPWGGKLQFYARVANYDSAPFATVLRLYGDEQPLDTREVDLAAEGETELTWTLPASYATLRAALDGGDGLALDDQGFLNVATVRQLNVLLVSATPDHLRRALAAVPGVTVTTIEPARYDPALTNQPQADLTVFESFLPPSWPASAVLAIDPPPGNPLLALEPLADQALEGALEQRGAVLEGLSLGGVTFGRVRPIVPPPWAETQLALGGTPLILRGRTGAHEIAIWAFDLEGSNLPTRLAFPLLVARTVRDLTPAPLPPAIQAGAPLTLRPDPRATAISISEPDGTVHAVMPAAQVTADELTQPGFYRVEERRGDTPAFVGQVGVNAGSALESNLRPQAAPAFASPATSGGGIPQRQVVDLWPWLALGALAVLMLEWGYIHR